MIIFDGILWLLDNCPTWLGCILVFVFISYCESSRKNEEEKEKLDLVEKISLKIKEDKRSGF